MSEYIIYALIGIAYAAIIWLMIQRDRIQQEQIVMNMTYFDLLDLITKHDKEIGEILAKLENLDTKYNQIPTNSFDLEAMEKGFQEILAELDKEKQNETIS